MTAPLTKNGGIYVPAWVKGALFAASTVALIAWRSAGIYREFDERLRRQEDRVKTMMVMLCGVPSVASANVVTCSEIRGTSRDVLQTREASQ